MNFIAKFIARLVLNGVALYVAARYLPGFVLADGLTTLAIAAVALALLNAFLRPILRLISLPIIWITFGLFNLVIHMLILWIADHFLVQLSIADLPTLFWASISIALANAFF